MRIQIVTPAARGSCFGNRITAERWARLLRRLGHRVSVREAYAGEPCDVLVALHALKSLPSIRRFHDERPTHPLLVTLTGTDVYHDLAAAPEAFQALELADRIIALQPLAASELPPRLAAKVRVIYQSAVGPRRPRSRSVRTFDVCVLGHLREVKDPFRAAEAARMLPSYSRIRVLQAGSAREPEMVGRARAEMESNPRYAWLGDLPHWRALRLLASSRLMVLSSRMEGGANAVSEALACGVPVVSSRIPGSIGLLGAEYPAYFPVGDTAALANLLVRCETDPLFYEELYDLCCRLAPLVDPANEMAAWGELLDEVNVVI